MSEVLNPGESGGKKYVAPEAARLGSVSSGRGSDCGTYGSLAFSACYTGSYAQACTNGEGTGGQGECGNGDHATHNCQTGSVTSPNPGCHTGDSGSA